MKENLSREELEKLSYQELSKLASELELEGRRIKKIRRRFVDEFWRRVRTESIKPEDLREGEMIGVRLGEMDILFANVEGEIQAFDNKCPHKGFPLHKGKLDGTTLTCAYHGGKFDLRSGNCFQHPYETYACENFSVRLCDDGTIECEAYPADRNHS